MSSRQENCTGVYTTHPPGDRSSGALVGLSVVVPVYNERECLPRVVDEMLEAFRQLPCSCEVILVDDGSSDGSSELVDQIVALVPEARAVHHPSNKGLGEALHTGYNASKGEWVTMLPGDGQIPPSEVVRVFDHTPHVDLFVTWYDHRADSPWRLLMSRALRLMMWATVGLRRRLEGFYLIRRSLLQKMDLKERSFLVSFEILLKADRLGARTQGTQIQCRPRIAGESKCSNIRTIWRVFQGLIRVRRALHDFRHNTASAKCASKVSYMEEERRA